MPAAVGDFLVLDAVRSTGGTAIAVSDEELLAEQRETARLEGSLICPEGAACITAVRLLRESSWLAESDEVVVLNTGAGLKYPDLVAVDVPVLAPGDLLPAPAGEPLLHAERGRAQESGPGTRMCGPLREAGGHRPSVTGGCCP